MYVAYSESQKQRLEIERLLCVDFFQTKVRFAAVKCGSVGLVSYK